MPLYINKFITTNIKFIKELFEENSKGDDNSKGNDNSKRDDNSIDGLIYIKIKEDNLDLAYISHVDLIENKIIDKDIVNNIKKNYTSKKIIYVNDYNKNYIMVL